MSFNQRHVRSAGRPVYGRPQMVRPARGRGPAFKLGTLPRRLIILTMGALLAWFVIDKLLAISTVKVSVVGNGHQAAQLKTEAQAAIATHWGQGSLLTFNAGELSRDLINVDPLVKSAQVTRHFPNSVTIVVTLKQPSLGWSSGDQSYLLDRDGTVIGGLPVSAANVPVVVDASNLPVSVGQRVTTTQFVGFVMALAPALAPLRLNPTRYEVKDTTLDLYVTMAAGYYVVFDTSRNPVGEVSDLKTLLGFMASQHKTAAQYVDLRISGRAYFQ